MEDYKELVAALREEAEAVQAIEWEIPICTNNHIAQAADVIEHLTKERDAAVADIRYLFGSPSFKCDICKFRVCPPLEKPCVNCGGRRKNWEWRGVQENDT